jgi:hypothetical protein
MLYLSLLRGTQRVHSKLLQAVPPSSKKNVSKSNESAAALLQLPHFDNEVLRKLARKKVKMLPGGIALHQSNKC